MPAGEEPLQHAPRRGSAHIEVTEVGLRGDKRQGSALAQAPAAEHVVDDVLLSVFGDDPAATVRLSPYFSLGEEEGV